MKYIGWLVFVILCFPAGQFAYKFIVGPMVASQIEEQQKAKEAEYIVRVQVGTASGPKEVTVDLRLIEDNEIPERVTLLEKVQVSSEDGSISVE